MLVRLPTTESFQHIVQRITETAATLRALRHRQQTAPLAELESLRIQIRALEDRLTALYDEKRAWHAATRRVRAESAVPRPERPTTTADVVWLSDDTPAQPPSTTRSRRAAPQAPPRGG